MHQQSKVLKAKGVNVVVYEPVLNEPQFFNLPVISNFDTFKVESDVIIANRLTEELVDVINKVYTRDIFSRDS